LPEEALALASSNRMWQAEIRWYVAGMSHFVLGQRDQARLAFEELIRVVESRRKEWTAHGVAASRRKWFTPRYLKTSRFYASLRNDDRFAALLSKYANASQ
jgi:hypothetical protein